MRVEGEDDKENEGALRRDRWQMRRTESNGTIMRIKKDEEKKNTDRKE